MIGLMEPPWDRVNGAARAFISKSLQIHCLSGGCLSERIDQGHRPELVGGGLIRSMGGWSAVLAMRRSGSKEVSDQRILGDGDFV